MTSGRALVKPRLFHCHGIGLLPSISPLKGHLYSLSASERRAMEAYINEFQVSGIISIFFLSKDKPSEILMTVQLEIGIHRCTKLW